MTPEIIIAFLVGALLVSLLRSNNNTTNTAYSPTQWLREATRSGVTVKVKATDDNGEWTLEFAFDVDLEELDRQALELREAGKKVDAIKLIRERLSLGLREAKDHVDAL